jgi:hypothetical protein
LRPWLRSRRFFGMPETARSYERSAPIPATREAASQEGRAAG